MEWPKINFRTAASDFLRHLGRLRIESAPAGGIYNIVSHHLLKVCSPQKGRGPHALRHACARRLIDSARTYKEVGDHLGHRNPDATRYYAKVNLASLRRVAFTDLGGLV